MPDYSDFVRDDYTRPILGAVAQLFDVDGATLIDSAVTGLDGQFTVTAPDGKYLLQVSYGGASERSTVLVGNPPEYVGPAGPADAFRIDLAAFKAAEIADGKSDFDGSTWYWTTGDFSATPAGQMDVSVVKANSTALSTGAWVRQGSQSITQTARRPAAVATSVSEGLQRKVSALDFMLEADKNLLAAASQPNAPNLTVAARLALDTSYAFSKALNSDSTYDPSLGLCVAAPEVPHSILSTIFQRNGQSVKFPGHGAEINFQGCAGPAFVLGKGADGSTDAFGPPCELTGLRSLGSSNTDPLIVVSVPGARLSGLFLTAPNIGIDIRNAADVTVTDSTIDQCQLAIQISESRNLIFSDLNIFIANEGIRFNSRVYDAAFSNIHINYPKTHGIYFNDGAGDIVGISFDNLNFMMNEQFSTFMAMIRCRASNVQFAMNGGKFRNWKDFAVLHDAGVGLGATFNGVQFNGARTDTVNYAQSSTAKVFRNGANSELDFTSCSFSNLPGQPFEFTGTTACSLRLSNPRFGANTGGTAEVLNTNTNASSRVRIVSPVADRALVTGSGAAVVDVFSTDTERGWTAATGAGSKAAYARYTTSTAAATYTQAYIQALADSLDAASARIIALETTLRQHGVIN